jgi:hypothetical protein
VRVLDELLGQLGQLGVALRERGQVRQPLAHRLGRGLGGPADENSPSVRPSAASTSSTISSSWAGAEPVAAGRRQVAGDVEDRLLAVVERRADVEPAPRQDVVSVRAIDRTGPALDVDPLGRLQPDAGRDAPKSPPSIRVAR